MDTPYDYSSIMHYKLNAFSRSSRRKTIVPLRRVRARPYRRISKLDVLQVKRMYNCDGTAFEDFIFLFYISWVPGRVQKVQSPNRCLRNLLSRISLPQSERETLGTMLVFALNANTNWSLHASCPLILIFHTFHVMDIPTFQCSESREV